jgi:hypothetical protein
MYAFQLLLGVLAVDITLAHPTKNWGPKKFKSLVTFGDSYTDDSRLSYFYAHNASAPPVGWEQPVVHTHFPPTTIQTKARTKP